MENITLFDSELKLMEILWTKGTLSAKEISLIAAKNIGWNKNTTYTILKKLVEKGAVLRHEPGFMCETTVSKEQVQKIETHRLIHKLYEGSGKLLISSFLESEKLSDEDLQELRNMIDNKSNCNVGTNKKR